MSDESIREEEFTWDEGDIEWHDSLESPEMPDSEDDPQSESADQT